MTHFHIERLVNDKMVYFAGAFGLGNTKVPSPGEEIIWTRHESHAKVVSPLYGERWIDFLKKVHGITDALLVRTARLPKHDNWGNLAARPKYVAAEKTARSYVYWRRT